jgi:quercetin dioxygenase-like cupin family protein
VSGAIALRAGNPVLHCGPDSVCWIQNREEKQMGFHRQRDRSPQEIVPGRRRATAHTDNLMMVVMDFEDGPAAQPDPPHSHPHEQVSYVAEGEVVFHLGAQQMRLEPGDMVAIPAGTPHSIQTLTARVRLVDVFHPIRKDFLER